MIKNCWKSFYICAFVFSKKQSIWFHKYRHNSRIVGHIKLPEISLNRIFNALLIGVQYTLSFQWTNLCLKCLFKGTSHFIPAVHGFTHFCIMWVFTELNLRTHFRATFFLCVPFYNPAYAIIYLTPVLFCIIDVLSYQDGLHLFVFDAG